MLFASTLKITITSSSLVIVTAAAVIMVPEGDSVVRRRHRNLVVPAFKPLTPRQNFVLLAAGRSEEDGVGELFHGGSIASPTWWHSS